MYRGGNGSGERFAQKGPVCEGRGWPSLSGGELFGRRDREWDYFRAAAGNRCAHVRNPFYRRIKGAEKPGRTGSVPVLCPEGRRTELVMKLAVFGGGNPVSFFKQMRKIMLIVVAKPQGDFPDGQIGVTQQILGRRYLF